MDVAYIAVGMMVPIVTFIGVWLWRFRTAAGPQPWDESHSNQAELARSVAAVRTRLDELHDQIGRWDRELEERDRIIAERIGRLIEVTERAAPAGDPVTMVPDDPHQAGRAEHGGG